MNLSQLEIARALAPGVSDVVLIERLVEDLSRTLELAPPTHLHRAASYQQIKTIRYDNIGWSGMLAPAEDGTLTITVRSSDSPHRRNFTIGHEIVHTLLPGYSVTQYRRLGCGGQPVKDEDDGRSGGTSWRLQSMSRHLERVADAGAAELLLPRRYVGPEFNDSAYTIASVRRIANAYHASIDATLRRLINLTDRPAIVLDIRRTTDADFTPRTSIHRAFSNSAWCPVAPAQLRGTLLAESHPLCEVFATNKLDDVVDVSFLPATTQRACVSAETDPYIDNEGNLVMRAIVLATPHHAMLRHELTVNPPTRLAHAS
ncbi:hypothetical protein FB382_002455 [Nocardioides ginsengisegetis]|uniref:IrrE N-terminal-like domain-containing protein n=1 Tax=Nocardioides ginsengisegetis TaxID=661491 RepID=A0A7W3PA62_9ACTN|nr:ImmA/IrrE family metallo-endopeptidase [Nocardioides ginsengisegetis]MBA8804164.1 hypothetical protein [Nocardioides ginsengisegetis]